MGAIRGGHYAVVELLLWRGADISQAEETSSTVSILLHSPSLCRRKYFPYVPFQGENDDEQNLEETSSTVSILLHSPLLGGRKYFPYFPFQGENNDDQNIKKIRFLVDRTRQVQCILNEL